METINEAAKRYCSEQAWANEPITELSKKDCVTDFKAGANFVLAMFKQEFVSDVIPDSSSCCYKWEMKEFINKLRGL